MAMTKKEKAAYDAAIKTAETAAALRWTEPVEPDVPVPKGLESTRKGGVSMRMPF